MVARNKSPKQRRTKDAVPDTIALFGERFRTLEALKVLLAEVTTLRDAGKLGPARTRFKKAETLRARVEEIDRLLHGDR